MPYIPTAEQVSLFTTDTSMPIARTGRKTAALIPDCRFTSVDGARHGHYVSEARRYNAALLDFIDSARAGVATSGRR